MAKVLIVEDDLLFALDLQREIERLGYEVIGMARNSSEALVVSAEIRPDLALLDINIPGSSDGIQTAHSLHSTYRIPVIFLSSSSDETTVARALLETPYAYLLKPFNRHELRTSIHVALNNCRPGDMQESYCRQAEAAMALQSLKPASESPAHDVLFIPPTAAQRAAREIQEKRGETLYEICSGSPQSDRQHRRAS